MAARLKSSVLRREERGFGSISMGRLLISGMAGGVAFMMASVFGLRILMIPAGLLVFIAGLVLTNPRHGIPLYLYLVITLRTRLLLDANRAPHGWQARVRDVLAWSPDALKLDASQLLSAPIVAEDEGTLDEWEIVPDSAQASGFEVVTDTLFSVTRVPSHSC